MRCRTTRTLCLVILVASIGSSACRREGRTSDRAQLEAAQASITAGQLAEHIRVLASDEFEGRLPGTAGEEKTLVYLRERFEAVGLEPGNAGSWFQDVPLVSIAASPGARLTVRKAGRVERFAYGDEIMVWTKRVLESVDLRDSELVFVGYGTVAPEYGWDDYADVDVRGKTVVMLVNDPGYATEDPGLFNGRAMTYYGRWTYKYEEAARQGAAAALIVHETAPAAYGWGVVQGSWTGPQFDMVTADDNMSRVKVEGWITLETAQRIFEIAGHGASGRQGRAPV